MLIVLVLVRLGPGDLRLGIGVHWLRSVWLIPLAVVALVSYRTADNGMGTITKYSEDALNSAACNQLLALRDVKRAQIEKYFAESDRRTLAVGGGGSP